jgi:ParD-like antitoxin of type II bacterial toxin-antitoxin system
MATTPIRIDEALLNAAKAAGEPHSRSAPQQLAHWVRIGKELEPSPSITHAEITRILVGESTPAA